MTPDNWIASLKPGDPVAVCGAGTYRKAYLTKVVRVLKNHVVTDGDSKFAINGGREAGSSRSWSWRYLAKPSDPYVVVRIQEQRLEKAQHEASALALKCDDIEVLRTFIAQLATPKAAP